MKPIPVFYLQHVADYYHYAYRITHFVRCRDYAHAYRIASEEENEPKKGQDK